MPIQPKPRIAPHAYPVIEPGAKTTDEHLDAAIAANLMELRYGE